MPKKWARDGGGGGEEENELIDDPHTCEQKFFDFVIIIFTNFYTPKWP